MPEEFQDHLSIEDDLCEKCFEPKRTFMRAEGTNLTEIHGCPYCDDVYPDDDEEDHLYLEEDGYVQDDEDDPFVESDILDDDGSYEQD